MFDVYVEHAKPTPILIPKCNVETPNNTQLDARNSNILIGITSTPTSLIDPLLELII